MNNKELTMPICAGMLAVSVIAVVCYLDTIFMPVIIALILAYMLEPLVLPLERRGMNRTLAVVLVLAGFIALCCGMAFFLFNSLRDEFKDVQLNLPDYAARLYGLIPHQVKVYLNIETPDKVSLHISNALSGLRDTSAGVIKEAFTVVQKAFASTLAFVLALLGYLITPLYLYYFLKDMPKIRGFLSMMAPESKRLKFAEKAREIDDLLSAFIRGQLTVCAILAVLYSVGLYFIDIDLAILIGVMAGVAFIIPYFGTILGIVLSMTMALLKFHDLLHPLLCLGWFGLVQAVEGAIITPKIVGNRVGLHPVIIILALFIGGQLSGILGMLLAVPLTAVLKVFGRSLLDYYRNTTYFRRA
jgi:predicted PurR-regulated permease PerM